ncbi:MAG: pimeloyl-ACP methyl ester carboxylesterase [Myxococcota bacterium]|jgi:pimeloyl-ACP methyl ester carboxylesterase
MDRVRALGMLVSLGRIGPVAREEAVSLGGGRCVVYASDVPRRGVVAMIHGMSPHAELDARWIQLARGFARCGLTAVTPHLDSIAALRMSVGQIDEVEGWIAAIADHYDEPVGLFSVSFSGGIALLAAARPAVRDRLTAVCVIGAFADVSETLRYVFADPDSDPYGRLITLGNFVDRSVDDPEGWLQRTLLSQAADNFHKRPHQVTAADIPEPFSSLLTALTTDPAVRVKHWEAVAVSGLPEITGLQVPDHVSGLRVPVSLIHGQTDRVIPPSQSVRLREAIAATGLPVELAVTPLLSHGDTKVGLWTTLRHAWPLISAFGAFIRRARTGSGTPVETR